MKILFASMPFDGHFNPLTALAVHLRERGHEVTEIDGIFGSFGHAHLIEVTDDGLAGAADPRALIGAAVGY